MISICIPLFNFDSRVLIRKLSEQAERLLVPYEIIAIDDGSDESFRLLHRELSLPCFTYVELPENVGRSKIRNILVEESHYPYLLFMDCDMMVASKDYLQHYLPYCSPNSICYGGRIYSDQKPEASYALHWRYGVSRESLPASKRKDNANCSFCTNNFMADKQLLKDTVFDEQLQGYGYEDTLIGLELQKKGIEIQHIDNPLIHIGLEPSSVYLSKVRNALQNLKRIENRLNEKENRTTQFSGILKMNNKLQRWRLKPLLVFFFRLSEHSLTKHLQGKHPSLFLFDMYRLGYYCSL